MMFLPFLSLILLGTKSGPVSKFRKAGAVTAASARKPASLKVNEDDVSRAVKRGVMIAVGDGRYYVDVAVHQRHQRRLWILLSALVMALAGLFVWISLPWW